MSTNPYYKNFNSLRHQALAESLILQSIKMFGYDVKYIPRTLNNLDQLFGEDNLSSFDKAATVEVYIKNIDGFNGQGRFLSKFGVEIRDQVTFSISRLRFDQIKTEKLLLENGYTLQTEDRPSYIPNQDFSIELEGTEDPYQITSDKPLEGDLIWFPLTNKLFEIRYVNYEQIFYAFGSLQLYDLECELYEYSSETFNTKQEDIDTFLNALSSDKLDFSLLLEDGGLLLNEDNEHIILENYSIENSVSEADNNLMTTETEDVVDWSQKSPLVKYNEYTRW